MSGGCAGAAVAPAMQAYNIYMYELKYFAYTKYTLEEEEFDQVSYKECHIK